ncbi:MAG: diaminopimelate decarboxylase [Bacteroidetes bacterium]|nr:diaminopimelate decarboxylase [Bacteroidota bacterium]
MQLVDGQYQIGGINLLDICKEFDTPLYVYDCDKITDQYKSLLSAFKDVKVKINYACKALTNINILKLMNQLGAGLDTVSIQEVELGLKAGFSPDKIIYTPNCVSFEEIQMAVDYGVIVNIDNIETLEQFGHEYGSSYPVCIRINPHILGGGNVKISTGHIDSKFGISIHQMRHVERIVANDKMNINGLHMHTGSDILDVDIFLRGAEILLQTASDYFPNLEFIDFGSGFKVKYRDNDIATDVESLGETLSKRFNKFCKDYGKDLEIMFEPGKFLVSESGYLLVHTNVIKQTTATVFAGVDSGQNHLIRPMMYDAYHKITNISNPEGKKRIYTVVGYICETDTFGWDRRINEVKEGDILAIHNAGAYGFSMSSNYNSRYRPAEVMIYKGKALLIRRRETMADLIATQVEQEL